MITGIFVERVTRKLKAQVRNARQAWSERSCLLITLHDDSGSFGQGEASPLPVYSSDWLEDCANALAALRPEQLSELDREADPSLLLARAVDLLPKTLPAARFGLEMALLDLAGKRQGLPAWALFGANSVPELGLAAWVGSALDADLRPRVEAALGRGIRTLKIKVGDHEASRELQALKALRTWLPRGVHLRLDANRTFDDSSLRERLNELSELDPEFVEEPAAPAKVATLDSSPVPLAFDESLQGHSGESAAELLRLPGVQAVVLKPMALGGFSIVRSLANAARSRGLDVIVSHLLDGPLALSAAAVLAFEVGSPDRAMGLDTHAGLDAWPEQQSPALGSDRLVAWTQPGLGLDRLRCDPP